MGSVMVKEKKKQENKGNKQNRPPVVAVLGHVDHGKSSLLEAIREDFVITKKESGGITQHIGAYEVEKNDQKITFIDTPGHEAFSAMRQRGANVADIALLVVDAGEGVKDQTKEAIKFIQKADCPMIVVFNKMDLPGAMPEKVKPQLSETGVLVESYGGKIPSVEVSAKDKTGIDELLETILLVAEMEELNQDDQSPAEGVVIESFLDPQKGPIASLVVRKGILDNGTIIVAGSTYGKIKSLSDFKGGNIVKGVPSQPVTVFGFNQPPEVGAGFKVYNSIEDAQVAAKKDEKERVSSEVVNVEDGVKILNLILKTDVLGSAEALEGILKNLPQDKVFLRILKSEVGDVSASDVLLAENGKARIFGFRVKVSGDIRVMADQKDINIKTFEVIYELVQEVRKTMLNILSPVTKRVDLAKFKITHLFKQSKSQQVIGGKVSDGELTKNTKVEILRDEEVIGAGRIKGLQQDKKEVGKVEKGKQAGLMLEADVQVEENDILQVFREDKEKDSL